MTVEFAVGLALALFGGGGVAALLRLRGENSRIVVDAAQGAVIVQSGVITDLRAQIADLTDRMSQVEGRAAEAEERAEAAEARAAAAEARAAAAEARALAAEQHRDILLRANTDLQERVQHLEAEVQRLKSRDAGTPT